MSPDLNPIIASMVVYIALVVIVPKIVTKPTGIKVIDDLVLLLISQKGSMMSGVILIGVITYLSKYVVGYIDGSASQVSSE